MVSDYKSATRTGGAADDPTTRARLPGAAGELVAEVGSSAVTTRAISERAGVNNAMVQYHFGSKTALVVQAALASIDDAVDEPIQTLRQARTVGADDAEVLRWIGVLDVDDLRVRRRRDCARGGAPLAW